MNADEIRAAAELAKSVPPSAWDKGLTIIKDLLLPVTATTSGIGGLIENQFKLWSDLQKINAAAALEPVSVKIAASGRPRVIEIQPKLIAATLEGAALETDPNMQKLWSNLLAQEFTVEGIHPLIPKILSQLTPADAQTLATFTGGAPLFTEMQAVVVINGVATTQTFPIFTADKSLEEESVSMAALSALGLIRKDVATGWGYTPLGNAFMEAVRTPGALGSVE